MFLHWKPSAYQTSFPFSCMIKVPQQLVFSLFWEACFFPTGESDATASSPIVIVVSPASPEKPPRSQQGFVLHLICSLALAHGLALHPPLCPPTIPLILTWKSNWHFLTNCVQNVHWTWWIAELVILGFYSVAQWNTWRTRGHLCMEAHSEAPD